MVSTVFGQRFGVGIHKMSRVKIKEIDSLFILRHAQRNDKVATTTSSIDFVANNNDTAANGYMITETYNPPLATFQSTGNKSNNGCVQAMSMGQQILNYIDHNIEESLIILKFHTSPYLRCIETIKFILDYFTKNHHDDSKTIRCIISIDQVLSEWLSTDLDINYYPPSDNGASLLSTAMQYLNSKLPFHRHTNLEIQLDLHNSYKHGNPGCFNESFIQQYSRLNNGLISIVKHETNNLSNESDSKDLVIIMTHGACVRSLVSKLLGRSLYVEIPLASLSIAKPLMEDSKHYYWQLLKTDIDTKLDNFQQIDLYSKHDPFQDFQTTFKQNVGTNQLNFKSLIPASKTENFNRIRSQSLLTPRPKHHDSDDEDNEDQSDDEGISFTARKRRPRSVTTSASTATDNQRRFRSSSLFGPVLKNPFFSDESLKSNNDDRKKMFIDQEDEIISPVQNLSKKPSQSNSSSFQNIHEDDGTFGGAKQDSNELVPDLGESFSSNNSSTNSLHEEMTNIVPGSFSKMVKPPSQNTSSSSTTLQNQPTTTSSTPLPQNSSSLFDKSLIEKTLQEINLTSQNEPDHKTGETGGDWLNFKKDTSTGSNNEGSNKFKIDLYGKKDRLRLNLYNNMNDEDEEDVQGSSGWFLGSNKY